MVCLTNFEACKWTSTGVQAAVYLMSTVYKVTTLYDNTGQMCSEILELKATGNYFTMM